MLKCLNCFKNEKVLAFIGGVAAATIGVKVLKSPCTRKAAVSVMAKGMKLQQDAMCSLETLKEDAQDLCHEAKQEADCKEETLTPQ